MTVRSVGSADESLLPIVKAFHRGNPCGDIECDIVAVDNVAQVSTHDEWDAATTKTDVSIAQDGVVSLAKGTATSIFSQTSTWSVKNRFADPDGRPKIYALDFFVDPNVLPSAFTLSSLDIVLGRMGDPGGFALFGFGEKGGTRAGTFIIEVGAYDDDWRWIKMGDPITIAAADVARAGSVETIDFTSRRIVFEPGHFYSRTGPGRTSAGAKRTLREDSRGVSHIQTFRGLSIAITVEGGSSGGRQQAFLGCIPNATASKFDSQSFWRVTNTDGTHDHNMGPYPFAGSGGVAWDDVLHNPDKYCVTGAVPGFGAKAVTNGYWGMARRVLDPDDEQASQATWEQPYHNLKVATYESTGQIVVPIDLGAIPTNSVEFRAEASTPKGTSIAYTLERSTDESTYVNVGSSTAISITDTFTRADNATSLGTTTTGSKTYTLTDTGTGAAFGISGNKAYRSAGSSLAYEYFDAGAADGTFTITVVNVPDLVGKFGHVLLRFVDASNYLRVAVPSSGNYILQKNVAGSITSVDTAGSAADGDVIECTLSGSSVSVKINTVATLSGTITDHTSATKFGFGDTNVTGNVTWDNVSFTGTSAGGDGDVDDGDILTGNDLTRYYRLTADLTPGPSGSTKYATPYLQAATLTSRLRFTTVRSTRRLDSSATIDPLTGKTEIAEFKVPLLRLGPRNARDLATQIASGFPPSRIEAQVYLVNRVTKERYFRESFRLESRTPELGAEVFTFVSGIDRLKVIIPPKSETFEVTDGEVTSVSNSSLNYTITDSGATYPVSDGMVGYRVRFLDGASEKQSYSITTNTGTTFGITIEDANAAPEVGDTFEIHSDIYTRAERAYQGQDLAAVYDDVMTSLAKVPERYRGALPATTGRTTSNRIPPDGRSALDVLQEVALHCGGAVAWERGRIQFIDIYGEKDSVFVWDDRHYISLESPTGQDRRLPSVNIPYDYNFTSEKFESEATFDDLDALLALGRANLSDVYKVEDKLAQWCNQEQATWLAETLLNAGSTGVRLWKVKTVMCWPWLRLGDAGTVVTRQYTDRYPSFGGDGLTDEGTALAGRTAALGVIVGKNLWGNEFLLFVRGLSAISPVLTDTGRTGSAPESGTLVAGSFTATRDVSDTFSVDFTLTRGAGNPSTTTFHILQSPDTGGPYEEVTTTTATSKTITMPDPFARFWVTYESAAGFTNSPTTTEQQE